MSCQVRWLVFLRVKSARKVSPLLDRFAETIGRETAVRECERYWKDQSLFRVAVTCQLPVDEHSSAVPAVLQMCWGLARSWILTAPQVYEGERWEFSGSAISQAIAIEGLTDIDFHACNWEKLPAEYAPVQNEADTAAR